jgi:ribosomal protein S18 acetylase RimI-like enzyme
MLEAYALHPDAFTSSVAERNSLPLVWWEQRLSASAQPNEVVFGAVVSEALCGVAGISFQSRDKVRHKATVFGMYVPARNRRQGVGRELMNSVLTYAESRPGTSIVQLTVTEGNATAQAFYASFGFVPFGTEPCAVRVGSGYVSKVHMWRDLQPLATETAQVTSVLPAP